MTTTSRLTVATLGVLACALTFNAVSFGQAAAVKAPGSARGSSGQSDLVVVGSTPGTALNPANDRGLVPDETPIEHIEILLKRSPEQELALQKLIEQLHRPGNPNYHKWLTAAEFAKQFPIPEANVSAVKSWLQSQGFKIDGVLPTGQIIMFSGNAGLVREAFHTEIHNLMLKNGEAHTSNVSDPKVPSKIASLIVGTVSLSNFVGHPMSHRIASTQIKDGKVIPTTGEKDARGEYTYTQGTATYYALVPGDVATIYNLNPLYAAGYTGAGTTIAVVEDSTMYNVADWTTFVSTFGLTSYGGTLTQTHPTGGGALTCSNPGDNEDDGEVEIDAEYATAAAPGATINVASCGDGSTNQTFGGLIAVQNLTNSATPPPVISMSYGYCEAENGATANAAFGAAFQQAAAQGISMFVSSGDESSTSCDADATYARHGTGISGWTSSPYNVSVGGTDFYDGYLGNESTYWNSSNGTYYNSAKSYIPEIPWNDSCASQLIATSLFNGGYVTTANTYGPGSVCNTSPYDTRTYYLTTASGSGGPSNCATGTPSSSGVSNGSCKGWAKPSYQSVYGNPADGVRDIPDVSLFAANGIWGHYYVVCYSHTADGGTSCAGVPSTWAGFGGTSVSSPIMAGIQALVDQYVGTTTNGVGAKQGNPNYVYYALASQEYGASGTTTCNSDSSPASSCVFYDVTAGDNNVVCRADGNVGTFNCYLDGLTNGVGSLTTAAYSPTYGTNSGWDFATGIGTVNAYNLATNWKNAFPTTTALTATPTTVATGGSTVLKATVSAATLDNALSGGTQVPVAGTVTFYDGVSSLATCTLASATCSSTVTYAQLTAGSNSITAVYSGSNAYPGSTSAIVVVTKTVPAVDITFSSVTHNFGGIAVGTSTTGSGNYGVQLTNNDSTAFPFALSFAGSTAFTENTNCGTSVAAGAKCEIIFIFTPTAAGTETATWSVGANGKVFSPSNGGTLTGIGLTNTVALYTAGHNFGKVTVGVQSATYGTVLTNGTASAVTLTLGSVTSPFITTANNCPATLASGASCNLQFAFKPTAKVVSSQLFSVKANGGATPIVTGSPATTVSGVTLVGTGQ